MTPVTFQPTSATYIAFGPGASWASANNSANSALVIHPSTSTTTRCTSGAIALMPPIATNDSAANRTAISAMISAVLIGQPSARSRFEAIGDRGTPARSSPRSRRLPFRDESNGNEHRDHPQQWPLQHADRHERGAADEQSARGRPRMDQK